MKTCGFKPQRGSWWGMSFGALLLRNNEEAFLMTLAGALLLLNCEFYDTEKQSDDKEIQTIWEKEETTIRVEGLRQEWGFTKIHVVELALEQIYHLL
jgi:hypothetical protein